MNLRHELLQGVAQDPLICSVFDDSGYADDGGGGGGGTDVAVQDDSPSGFEQDDEPQAAPAQIDLDSTDPAVLYSREFPRNRKLSTAQIQAVMNYNPLAHQQPTPGRAPMPAARQPAPAPAQAPQQIVTDRGILPQGYKLTAQGQIIGPQGRFVSPDSVPWIKPKRGQARAQAPAPQVPAPQADQRIEQLIQGFNEALQQRTAPAQAEPQAPAQPKHMYGPGGLKPGMVIPPQILQMLNSDDEAQRNQGVTLLANGVANTVVQDIVGMMASMRQDIVENHVPAVIQRQTSEQASRSAFYQRYPQLNKKELKGFIAQISQTVGMEWRSAGYDWRDPTDRNIPSVQFMDAVAQRYAEIVGGFPQAEPQAQPQNVQVQPQVGGPHVRLVQPSSQAAPQYNQQPYFPQQGARPPAASPASSKSEEINAVIRSR